MAISQDALARLIVRPSSRQMSERDDLLAQADDSFWGGGNAPSKTTPTPTPKPSPSPKGRTATDENRQPVWMPVRTGGIRGIQAMAPDNAYRSGGVMPRMQQGGMAQFSGPAFYAQQGGVAYPGIQLDAAGLPTLENTEAPRQQSSPVAGEPTKKQPPTKQQEQPQKYEFGPSDFYYTPEAFRRLMEAHTAALQQGMKSGGIIQIPRQEFKQEHNRLLKRLDKKDPEELNEERDTQAEEMKEKGMKQGGVVIPPEVIQHLMRAAQAIKGYSGGGVSGGHGGESGGYDPAGVYWGAEPIPAWAEPGNSAGTQGGEPSGAPAVTDPGVGGYTLNYGYQPPSWTPGYQQGMTRNPSFFDTEGYPIAQAANDPSYAGGGGFDWNYGVGSGYGGFGGFGSAFSPGGWAATGTAGGPSWWIVRSH